MRPPTRLFATLRPAARQLLRDELSTQLTQEKKSTTKNPPTTTRRCTNAQQQHSQATTSYPGESRVETTRLLLPASRVAARAAFSVHFRRTFISFACNEWRRRMSAGRATPLFLHVVRYKASSGRASGCWMGIFLRPFACAACFAQKSTFCSPFSFEIPGSSSRTGSALMRWEEADRNVFFASLHTSAARQQARRTK